MQSNTIAMLRSCRSKMCIDQFYSILLYCNVDDAKMCAPCGTQSAWPICSHFEKTHCYDLYQKPPALLVSLCAFHLSSFVLFSIFWFASFAIATFDSVLLFRECLSVCVMCMQYACSSKCKEEYSIYHKKIQLQCDHTLGCFLLLSVAALHYSFS